MRILHGEAAEKAVAKLTTRSSRLDELEPRVRRIIRAVRSDGDKALTRYATTWDGLQPSQSIRVTDEEIAEAWQLTPLSTRTALRRAAANIRRFCRWQMPREWRKKVPGGELGQILRPLDSVGCYVPGGRYPLPSTLLMTVIPAQVAGVPRICVVSPRPQPATLAAAALLGVHEMYRCGGAQAIAALAYGTESVPRVDKIVGPGNSYVAAAKKLVSFDCAIDMLAGPTEAVVCSDRGNPRFLAADLVAQAEHDPDAVVVFITTRLRLAKDTQAAMHHRQPWQCHCAEGDPPKWAFAGGKFAAAGTGLDQPHRSRTSDDRRRQFRRGAQRRLDLRRRLLTAIGRRLCCRAESRFTDRRCRAFSGRVKRP